MFAGLSNDLVAAGEARSEERMSIQSCIREVEQKGYCTLPKMYSCDQVRRALELAEYWMAESSKTLSCRVPFLNRNQPMVYNLQNKDIYFLQLLFECRPAMAVLKHFLNDPWYKAIPADQANFVLRSYLARSSNEVLPMHIDSFLPYGGPHVFIMQCAIALEDQRVDNGCTVVVPGSHLAEGYATQESFKDAVPIESKAGDVVLWDSRLWHGTGENRSGGSRWALIATFSRWWLKQAFNIPENLPQSIYDRLSDEQRAVLGFCSMPYDDESAGIDMKRGYDDLPERVEDCRRGASVETSAS